MLLKMALGAVLLYAPAVVRASLITNGGFETGDFTGWTVSTNNALFVRCGDAFHPARTGNCDSRFYSSIPNSLTQNIITTSSSSYALDFWLEYEIGAFNQSGTFSVTWRGVTIFSSTDGNSSVLYTHEIFPNLSANSGSTALIFAGNGVMSRYLLDDVNLVANSTVPEPGTFVFIAVCTLISTCLRSSIARRIQS